MHLYILAALNLTAAGLTLAWALDGSTGEAMRSVSFLLATLNVGMAFWLFRKHKEE